MLIFLVLTFQFKFLKEFYNKPGYKSLNIQNQSCRDWNKVFKTEPLSCLEEVVLASASGQDGVTGTIFTFSPETNKNTRQHISNINFQDINVNQQRKLIPETQGGNNFVPFSQFTNLKVSMPWHRERENHANFLSWCNETNSLDRIRKLKFIG
jgi:hypothetical protein